MCVPRSRAKLISRFIGLNYDNKDTYLQFTYVCMLCIYYGVCTATDTDTHTDNTLNKKPTVGMEFLQWICLTYTKINLLQQRFLASINLCANTIFICYMKISFSIACSISCRDFERAFYNIPCMYIKHLSSPPPPYWIARVKYFLDTVFFFAFIWLLLLCRWILSHPTGMH